MREVMTKAMARNIFYGGSLFFILIFVGLTAHSHYYVVAKSTAGVPLTDSVARGKRVWEANACINCHTIHGEGAYFAPEVGNVMTRWGVVDSPEDAFQALKGWLEAQPSGTPGRRQMPRFHLSDEDIRGLSDFLIWADKTNTQTWPPKDSG
ncbi:MAG: cytochrome c [Hyphomicrobium sp.]|uniref:c-type cytochrome n=1 Tax=Hyphomicrobium sp. TaxID=82 RepID=UPI001326D1E0|nr:cytochrome c [Hyphomicrobium sp.]KAB2942770.1 MAG: cytochrome c [Hyphomicrobium sp.]MBZ0211980.1 cytochrome c [Hyphomicrobium sp.]MCZ7593646.1 cytochrome c [Hyphomicrobium sp.]